MNLHLHTPKKALNKAFLKLKPSRTQIDSFKANLFTLLNHVNEAELEEFHKNLIATFLNDTYYKPDFFINTKGRNDQVIHNGKDAKSTVGVIIETKKPGNKSEMLRPDNINTKAFHELVLYYMRERISNHNTDLKNLIATNLFEWFIFDAQMFEKLFAANKSFVKDYTDFAEGRKGGNTTDFFYKEIAEPFVANIKTDIYFTHFDIRTFIPSASTLALASADTKLISLYKIFSPQHLLKLPFTNDSNSLDKVFYAELLHIIGLAETKDKNKKLIERKIKEERSLGSLIENAINQLDILDKVNRMPDSDRFGANYNEKLFNVGLELCITWINRILFLKLMEAQLINYHKGDKSYAFLNMDKIKSFDDLNSLFFSVLARRPEDRNEEVKTKFEKVPYLNSSLFESAEIEDKAIYISNLNDDREMPLHPQTVLKDNTGKRLKGKISALEYMFRFLDAYDFSSEGSEEIQEESKSLINASVLGLIFEKINGYKDGSFFTPGFITMYMCRETIRRAVVQKFNEAKGWNCESINDVFNKDLDIAESNNIVNSIKICDPAVGSGHFLVSALNEIIAIKNDLKILADREGKRLKHYNVEVVNDELIITDEEGELFEYIPGSKESQRVQEALFHEKQAIIENCLFGVDINPNSVKICRLRLWIELLKNAYYKADVDGFELETLPNIDINIKRGNSLISRFPLDADLGQALKQSRWTIDSYRMAVQTYRNAHNKEQKREMLRLINDIKNDFRTEIGKNDPKLKKLKKLEGEIFNLTKQTAMFEQTKKEKEEWTKKLDKLTKDAQKLEAEIEDIKNNKIFDNAFEWRFEFPEVLDDDGNFIGFDVVIGNPPYISVKEINNNEKKHYIESFNVAQGQFDLYIIFIELAHKTLREKGIFSMITSSTYLSNKDCNTLRKFLLNNVCINEIINLDETIFQDAKLDVGILSFNKKINNSVVNHQVRIAKNKEEFINGYRSNVAQIDFGNFPNHEFKINLSVNDKKILYSIKSKNTLGEICNLNRGVEFGGNSEEIIKEQKDGLIPIIVGGNIGKYCIKKISGYTRFNHNDKSVYKDFTLYSSPRILIQRIRNLSLKERIVATYTDETLLCTNTLRILTLKTDYPILTLLGIINSRLINYFFSLNFNNKDIYAYQLAQIPLPFDNSEISEQITKNVNIILSLKNSDPAADTTALEAEIDSMVYELYGLSEEEVRIVEGGL